LLRDQRGLVWGRAKTGGSFDLLATAYAIVAGCIIVKLSIFINNYNYARFVGQAIESSLAIDWCDKEIVVVGDGSTDDSHAVIEKFGDRVIPIFHGERGSGEGGECRIRAVHRRCPDLPRWRWMMSIYRPTPELFRQSRPEAAADSASIRVVVTRTLRSFEKIVGQTGAVSRMHKRMTTRDRVESVRRW
jgi:hypothetical protein